ncbi:ABC transporter substrate-binding protein [Velocimicrobium porci]|uniref:ABC transporter substrate-binding protein n=1 Tax=Velocimicrobium porci TaxID=2606634 RepID=A0A6L5XVJ7_9FIRM|nr:ABC transporter substrate-binding protein [Velocimicrobium porci]MSS62782.1 ABC transporter substrate-binding protein [Velocimicrobium porci]
MKKFISMQLVIILLLSILVGCSGQNNTDNATNTAKQPKEIVNESTDTDTDTKTNVSVTALKGPTAMGMVKFMDDADSDKSMNYNYNFSIAASVDEVTPALIQGKTDIAAVPANLASVLYNNTKGNMEVLAVNTLGVLYIVENGNSIQSVKDLTGKTIYASGKGATPEYALNYILSNNGVDPKKDVTIEWKNEHTECLAALTDSKNSIAMLPQPFVTTAQAKISTLNVSLDLTKEWNKLQKDGKNASALITGVVVAKKDFIEKNPEIISDFLKQYEKSISYVNKNIEEGAELIGKYNIVDSAVAKKAIPSCNITYMSGTEMKEKLSGYLKTLFEQNPASIGGALPKDDFYYEQ